MTNDFTAANARRVDVPPPLGVHWRESSTSVAVATDESAQSVELVVFGNDSSGEERFTLKNRLGRIWWDEFTTLRPQQRYGFRVHGPAHDPAKLLLDPYARAIEGSIDWTNGNVALRGGESGATMDSAPFVPKSVVVDSRFDWEGDQRLDRPWHDTVIYEVHVKGATKAHPDIPEQLRGTYAGLAHPAFVDHLQRLGVTAVELLPIHHIGHEERLVQHGLTNYWGYNSIGFFAPHDAYSASGTCGQQVDEFKGMVKLLHRAGIEVLLDVVYNHTSEAGANGPTLFLRGLSPLTWYRHDDVTGCGNTVDCSRPDAVRLVLDSLRYWVEEMHVDGFRFDLATALARTPRMGGGFDVESPLLSAIAQDPVLRTVKLIAEPWDVGHGGYQVGGFPAPWAEWNDRYRDLVRDYWRGAPTSLGDVAHRLSGSSDLFSLGGRRHSWTSINFVTAHDGFCLRDLVSYEHKRNEANGEGNRDGSNDNRSWNCGVEGETNDPSVLSLRARQQRNLLGTLLLSQGTPMLVAGDEMGRTQGGNNNAYCQDNATSWLDWERVDQSLMDFVSALIRLRRTSASFQRTNWLADEEALWFAPNGDAMTVERWNDPTSNGLAMLLRHADQELFVAMNEGPLPLTFSVPAVLDAAMGEWELVLSSDEHALLSQTNGACSLQLCDRSFAVLRRPPLVDP